MERGGTISTICDRGVGVGSSSPLESGLDARSACNTIARKGRTEAITIVFIPTGHCLDKIVIDNGQAEKSLLRL